MTDYIRLRIDMEPCAEAATDLAAAFLADIGYESFEPDRLGLSAYITASAFDPEAAREALEDFPIDCRLTLSHECIEGRDWNAEWEKNYFKPISIGDCLIHSSFHTELPEARYDIVIDPKMAFGTGHHSTTSLMVGYLLELDIAGKSVIDMGTGTGILAILCAMRGASCVTGIEIDPGAHANALENVALNNIEASMVCGDAAALEELEPADFFLANINRNIILADLPAYASRINSGGTLLLSGFYDRDVAMVVRAAAGLGFSLAEKRLDNDWAALRLTKE